MKNNQKFSAFPRLTSSIFLILGISAIPYTTACSNQSNSSKAEQVPHTKFPLGFSVSKIDTTVDPKQDFQKFAAGKWLDGVQLTPDLLRASDNDFLGKRVSQQVQKIVSQAAAQSTKASKGSPLQQVGNFYSSGMDEKRLKALGVSPLKPMFDRVEAINSPQTLTETLADLSVIFSGDDMLMFGVEIGADTQNRTINSVYVGDRQLSLLNQAEYLNQDTAATRSAYLKYITDNLKIAGDSPEKAAAAAKKILEIETRLASKKLSPVEVNATYDTSKNGIEIPAAFLQPPYFDSKGDAAVNFCSMGAVIGHEMTHGFDSQGRLYNAQGNLQNWWTDEDAAKFVAQTDKLVKQANAFEVLPGLKLNGKLTVGENLADAGGVSLAYEALQKYLKENPQANQKIDGYTPEQRCFIAWSQLWAMKANEGLLRQLTATDPHASGSYRGFAPFQHEDGFYKAFGIKPGDPMWLDEKDRVKIW